LTGVLIKKAFENIHIPKPSVPLVLKAVERWERDEDCTKVEKALEKLFQNTFRLNTKLEEVLIKVCTLNKLYNTSILKSVITVAEHIVELKIDRRLEADDEDLVNEIAAVQFDDKPMQYFSFATKYCSFHKPEAYPIYDRNACTALIYFKEKCDASCFKAADLRRFPKYKKIVLEFQKAYGLTQFSFKELDHYLWYIGDEILRQQKKLSK
jgi:hypothetical protein